MTTESDFQQLLNADPTDWQTRLIFADWLQERNDIRAAGYRALGLLRLRPLPTEGQSRSRLWFFGNGPLVIQDGLSPYFHYTPCLLQANWFEGIPSVFTGIDLLLKRWRHLSSRQEAEDAAAKAFALLDPTEQAALCPS